MLSINPDDKLPKVKQIIQAITTGIEKGVLQLDQRLPSITEFSKKHKIARDTVEKAYNRLKDDGYLVSVPGKGNYVAKGRCEQLKILLILNKLSSYKREVHDAFVKKLANKAKVDLQIHHYDPKLLKEILDNCRGKYHYYVIMPHFFHDANESEYLEIIQSINPTELVLLDKKLRLSYDNYISVYQDFKQDIYDALNTALDRFEKYKSLTVVFPKLSHHPIEITEGVKQFCKENKKKFSIIPALQNIKLKAGQVYITLTERELAELIKKVRVSDLKMGNDIGIISFNETVFKELLDITVITTDFDKMGDTAARFILTNSHKHERNSFKMILRESL